eukprot:920982-Pyramimonas_sp.AAC.1
MAERMGDVATATKYKTHLDELRRGPDLSAQELAQRCHERIQKLEEMLGSEVDKLEQYQGWVAIQMSRAQKLEATLQEADTEYANIVSELARTVAKGEDAQTRQEAAAKE